MEEILRVMEGINIPRGVNAAELSLVHGLVIPHKFKTLVFDKYDGTKCPTAHLMMYCRKMSAHTNNDKLLIYCLQNSLTGIAAQWYLKLDRTHIRFWKDLARAFLTQHKHATDFTPDRLSLQTWRKRIVKTLRITLEVEDDGNSSIAIPYGEGNHHVVPQYITRTVLRSTTA